MEWLQELWEIIRWVTVWNTIEWIRTKLQGKAVVTAIVLAIVAYLTKHPALEYGAIGGAGTCAFVLIWDHLQSTSRNQLPRFISPQRTGSTSLAISVELVRSIQHDMESVFDGYRDLVTAWNRFWMDLQRAYRTHKNSSEWPAIRTAIGERDKAAVRIAIQTLDRRLELALNELREPRQLRTLDEPNDNSN